MDSESNTATEICAFLPQPLEIHDGTWVVEGPVVIAGEHHLVSKHGYGAGDKVFIVSLSHELSHIKRLVRNARTRQKPDGGWVVTLDCVWLGDEPFAVFLKKPTRNPLSINAERFAEHCTLDLYWPHQSHKNGEFKQYLEVDPPPTITATRPGEEPKQWVRLDVLTDMLWMFKSDIVCVFLALPFIGDKRQPNCVYAKDEAVLSDGSLGGRFRIAGTDISWPVGSLAHGAHDEALARDTEVWVSLPAALDILRLSKLGIASVSDFDTVFGF